MSKHKLIFIGSPGSGKGTQAQRVAERLRIPHISTGDILREAVKSKSELGRKAEPIMASGALVPDDLMVGIIGERLKQPDAGGGFILDGFPRTVPQAEKLDRLVEGNGNGALRVIHLLVPDEVIVRRVTSRRVCSKCGAIYNTENSRPKVEGVCDRCGGAIVARPDDVESAVQKRLDAFHQQTMPVVEHYRSKNLLKVVDGNGPVDQVFERLEASIR